MVRSVPVETRWLQLHPELTAHVLHPDLGFRVPPRFLRLLDWLLEGWDPKRGRLSEHARRKIDGVLYDCTGTLLYARAGVSPGKYEPNWELSYPEWPLEMIPFAANGGDGLMYGWALLAPELDLEELPCASFAPVDDAGAAWLGDDIDAAIETMLIGHVRGAELWHQDDPTQRPGWQALCNALGLAPDLSRTDVKAGARTAREIEPPVPDGWRYVRTPRDGIGVLAPLGAFSGEPLDEAYEEEPALRLARRHLDEGHPATALAVVKLVPYPRTWRALTEIERAANVALGREALVQRADARLAYLG